MSELVTEQELTIVTKQQVQFASDPDDKMFMRRVTRCPDCGLYFYRCKYKGALPDYIRTAGRKFQRCCEEYYLDISEKGLVGSFFDHLSSSYETAILKERNVEAYRWVLAGFSEIHKKSQGWLLDLGAGHGFGVKTYEEIPYRTLQLVALDISRRMLIKCPEWSERIVGHAQYLSFKGESLLGVIAVYTLHYMPQPKFVFKEIVRTLVRGGVLGLVTYSHDPHKSDYCETLKAVGFRIVKFEESNHDPSECRLMAVKL